MPLDSQFYVVRPADDEFLTAITRGDSIVLVKGARQMGKTSLLARGLQQAAFQDTLLTPSRASAGGSRFGRASGTAVASRQAHPRRTRGST